MDALLSKLKEAYYIPRSRAHAAAKQGSSFNAIHTRTMFKVDIFVARSDAFRKSSLERRKREHLTDTDAFYVTSATDIVLHKLQSYRDGGEVSERQWQDVVGVLRVKGEHLDTVYLEKWASELRARDLLDRATDEAGTYLEKPAHELS